MSFESRLRSAGLAKLLDPTKVARLRTLPNDIQGGTRPDAFYDINKVTLYISRKF